MIDFAKIGSPLNQLLCKDSKFVWTDACEQAFKALKDALFSAPILAFPDFHETFHLYTDTSNEGIGVTLGQIQNDGEVAITILRPLVFLFWVTYLVSSTNVLGVPNST